MGTGGSFHGCKAAGASSWSLTSVQCRGQENVDLYMHCPLSLHGVVLNSLSIGTILSLPLILHIWRASPPSDTWGRAMPWRQGTHLRCNSSYYLGISVEKLRKITTKFRQDSFRVENWKTSRMQRGMLPNWWLLPGLLGSRHEHHTE
jgi:hypothetical protein